MNLSREDVEDILRILDSTDYDELHLETDRFALRLRRTPGGWTAEQEARGEARMVADRLSAESTASESAPSSAAAGPGASAPSSAAAPGMATTPVAPAPTGAPAPTVAPAPSGTPSSTAGATHGREGLHPVRAPLPGVFYRAPKPGAPPFVDVGDHVEADTVVAILETMKLMNPVRAGAAGTVADFAAANNEPAAQGAVLLWLEPDVPEPSGP